MRYLIKKDKSSAILLATTEEDAVALEKMWQDQVLRGAYLLGKGVETIHEDIRQVLKNFPQTKSYILITN